MLDWFVDNGMLTSGALFATAIVLIIVLKFLGWRWMLGLTLVIVLAYISLILETNN